MKSIGILGSTGSIGTQTLDVIDALPGKFQIKYLTSNQNTELLGEQALSAGGLTEGSGQIGGLSGIDYMIYGSITKLGSKENAIAIENTDRKTLNLETSL